jgi:CRP-like cAMP-binding protein
MVNVTPSAIFVVYTAIACHTVILVTLTVHIRIISFDPISLTSAQIRRIAARGNIRAMDRGEVLYEQGDSAVSFFVVVSGELEVVRHSGAVETLVTVINNHRSPVTVQFRKSL